jgi:hypothetical protein
MIENILKYVLLSFLEFQAKSIPFIFTILFLFIEIYSVLLVIFLIAL